MEPGLQPVLHTLASVSDTVGAFGYHCVCRLSSLLWSSTAGSCQKEVIRELRELRLAVGGGLRAETAAEVPWFSIYVVCIFLVLGTLRVLVWIEKGTYWVKSEAELLGLTAPDYAAVGTSSVARRRAAAAAKAACSP